jgi:hypothetical protein
LEPAGFCAKPLVIGDNQNDRPERKLDAGHHDAIRIKDNWRFWEVLCTQQAFCRVFQGRKLRPDSTPTDPPFQHPLEPKSPLCWMFGNPFHSALLHFG